MSSHTPKSVRGWEPVTTGQSGAAVFRSTDGSRYLKRVGIEQQAVLERERDRIDWARAHGVPTAEVLDWSAGADGADLVTSRIEGVSADRLSATSLSNAWPSIVETVRRLHALPVDKCPFTHNLRDLFAMAEDVVRRGAVNPPFLPIEIRQAPPAEILARLAAELEHRLAQEAVDTVVCHGDLCLANIIIDPETGSVSGLIDLGRLGRADRYVDIALLLSNSRGTWSDEGQARDADAIFADGYGVTLDHDRQRFYRHLDPLTWEAG
ncbi:MAG: streptomycin 3''-kinase [Frankiaceae bacterium]|jgi:streptomycin 3"-kinase|nr:streptomycin 3''-kinase [Frankiaceae bacterium]